MTALSPPLANNGSDPSLSALDLKRAFSDGRYCLNSRTESVKIYRFSALIVQDIVDHLPSYLLDTVSMVHRDGYPQFRQCDPTSLVLRIKFLQATISRHRSRVFSIDKYRAVRRTSPIGGMA